MRSMKFVLSRVQLAALCALVAAGCVTVAASAQSVDNNGIGTNNGYYYSLYSSGGSATMTFPSASRIPAITPLPGLASVMWSAVKAGVPAVLRRLATMSAPPAAITLFPSMGGLTSPLVEYYITEFGSLYTAECNVQGQCLQRRAHLQHLRASASQPAFHSRHRDFRAIP